jgi:CMP-N,N'-diacetyllegionaminic acid synthase
VRILGLIPARGGSKGIPGKNLVPLAGKPLLLWTVEAALAAETLERVVVSTDDDQIAAAAGCEVLRRPPALATDEALMLDVVLHAVAELAPVAAVCVLQPTSPLRSSEHVDGAVRLFEQTGADAVVSVVPVPHRFLPGSLMALEAGRLVALDPAAPTRRQDKRVLYARNGPAVLVVRAEGIAERGLYGGDVRPYEMALADSVDVDGPLDLILAEALLRPGPATQSSGGPL